MVSAIFITLRCFALDYIYIFNIKALERDPRFKTNQRISTKSPSKLSLKISVILNYF